MQLVTDIATQELLPELKTYPKEQIRQISYRGWGNSQSVRLAE